MIRFIIAIVAASVVLASPALARDINKGDSFATPNPRWVVVKNLEGVLGKLDVFEYGEKCFIQSESIIKVIGFDGDRVLVRLVKKKTNDAGFICPIGILFFLPRSELGHMTRYEPEKEKELINRLLREQNDNQH